MALADHRPGAGAGARRRVRALAHGDRPAAGATAAAQRASEALAQRTIGDGAFGSTVGPAEVDDLAATLLGMGTLRPTITVESVQLRDDGREERLGCVPTG